ncbi:hypothetical protein AK812_SmicGene35473 [Symbiodinium microadriaticum]|uniref:Uncharacterized protein n=1 Tax=Symbiodinium microadriaticum TaxID=2951 RepID=A0A1Q9CLB9_SYMMI|nr:hypothetical protein AK812_SmicGene35473 [Symbiodinium microadriaticum]
MDRHACKGNEIDTKALNAQAIELVRILREIGLCWCRTGIFFDVFFLVEFLIRGAVLRSQVLKDCNNNYE